MTTTTTSGAPHTCVRGPLCPDAGHICPREAFLDDPITQAYGIGDEMLHLIRCAVCDRIAEDGFHGLCSHESCAAIIYGGCPACQAAGDGEDEGEGETDEQCHHGLSLWLCADPVNHYPAGL